MHLAAAAVEHEGVTSTLWPPWRGRAMRLCLVSQQVSVTCLWLPRVPVCRGRHNRQH